MILLSTCIAFILLIVTYIKRARTGDAQKLPSDSPAGSVGGVPSTFQPTRSDIYHTAFILSHFLPADLVPSILDHAQYWHHIRLATATHPLHISEANAGTVYLSAQVPWSLAPNALRALTFTTTSHDQGFSWDRAWHGTYEHSWTWFEVAVLATHSGGSSDQDAGVVNEPRKHIITNIHADRNLKTHSVRWRYDDEDKQVRKIMQRAAARETIALTVWARFPAWINSVSAASIDAEVAAVTRL